MSGYSHAVQKVEPHTSVRMFNRASEYLLSSWLWAAAFARDSLRSRSGRSAYGHSMTTTGRKVPLVLHPSTPLMLKSHLMATGIETGQK